MATVTQGARSWLHYGSSQMNSTPSKGTVIFHHPGPVASKGQSGSQVRPWRLLEAFRTAGYDVEPVIGYGAERQRNIKRLLGELAQGRPFSCVYAESRSIPTLLAEKHRLPLYPRMDFQFLRTLRQAGVPVGLFYRDVFWRFDMYRGMLPWPARAITVPLYHYDWWWYQRVVNHLFLPSTSMATHLPTAWPSHRLSALPPGAVLSAVPHGQLPTTAPRPLQLLYVGGVQPPTYDLEPLFAVVSSGVDFKLTLCCRPNEWQRMKVRYAPLLNERVEIVHQAGEALTNLYGCADLFVLLWKPYAYLDFAVPVKVFESIGYGVPILTLAGTEAARIVEQYDLGWVAPDTLGIAPLLRRLAAHPELIEQKRRSMLTARERHTWLARVEEITLRLASYRQKT